MKHDPDVLPSHYALAEAWSVKAFRDLTQKRDAALSTLYYSYGPVVTEAMTGWTRPTIMAAVRKEEGKLAEASRRSLESYRQKYGTETKGKK